MTTGAHASQFALAIVDTTRGNETFVTYQTTAQTQNPQAKRNSAEWIVEAPTVGNGQAAVANFGSVNFTNASATINGVTGGINSSSWQSLAVNMVAGGATKDTTSVLSNSGSTFTETYNSSAANAVQSSNALGTTFTESESKRPVVVAGISLKKTEVIKPRVVHGQSAKFGASNHSVSHSHFRRVH
jgi:Peptidase A4 family